MKLLDQKHKSPKSFDIIARRGGKNLLRVVIAPLFAIRKLAKNNAGILPPASYNECTNRSLTTWESHTRSNDTLQYVVPSAVGAEQTFCSEWENIAWQKESPNPMEVVVKRIFLLGKTCFEGKQKYQSLGVQFYTNRGTLQ